MNLKNLLKTRRGVSQVIGSIFMLAIVAAIGSLLLIQGIQGTTDFTVFVDSFTEGTGAASREDITILHVRFDPTSDDVFIWLKNTGDINSVIDRITMVKVNSQELIINNSTDNSGTIDIFPEESKLFAVTGTISLPSGCSNWSDETSCNVQTSTYILTIVTSRGNAFETVVMPFNT